MRRSVIGLLATFALQLVVPLIVSDNDSIAHLHFEVSIIVLCDVILYLIVLLIVIPKWIVAVLEKSETRSENALDDSITQSLLVSEADSSLVSDLDYRQKVRIEVFRRKSIMLYIVFIVQCSFAIFTGVQVVTMNQADTLDMIGYVIIAFSPFLSFYFFERYTHRFGQDEGILMPNFHSHPMQFYAKGTNRIKRAKCDACRVPATRIDCFCCPSCVFTICVLCMKKPTISLNGGTKTESTDEKVNDNDSTTAYIWRILSFSFAHKPLLLTALVCLLINAVSGLLLPHFQGHILDQVVKNDREKFLYNVKYFGILSCVTAVFGAIRNLCLQFISRNVVVDVRNYLFSRIMHQEISFFNRMQSGQLTARLTNDVNAMLNPVRTLLNSLVANAINFTGGLIMCFFTSWRLSVLCLTIIGPVIYITKNYATWSKGVNRKIQAAFGDANAVATEAFCNIQTIKTFSTESQEIKNYLDFNAYALQKSLQDALGSAGTNIITSIIQLGATFVLLFYGGSVVLDEADDPNPSLTIGSLITFQLYWNMLTNAITNLSDNVASITQSAGAAQRVLGLIDTMPPIDPDAGVKLKTLHGSIRVENVQFFYETDPGRNVLDDFELNVQPGQICSLVGTSGCGKSTTLNLITGLFKPQAGRIYIDGIPLSTLNLCSFHKYMGVVTQDTQLFARTVRENIAYGLDPSQYTEDDVIQAAKQAFAHDFIMEFHDGYDTLVGERGVRMSGGQRQRISIARAFMRKPKLLLLDEATSALDAEAEELVQNALDNLIRMRTATILLVAHRLSSFMSSDVIAVMQAGRIVELGKHDELLQRNAEYTNLVKRQLHRKPSIVNNSKK